MARNLTPKQEGFVREYLVNGRNAAAAYRAAYNTARMSVAAVEKEVKRLLKHPLISPRIQEVIRAVEKETELTVEWVLSGLKGEATLQGEGSSHSARVRAYELIGKHKGMFPSKHEHEHTGAIEVQVMTDDQREQALQRLYARLGKRRGSADTFRRARLN